LNEEKHSFVEIPFCHHHKDFINKRLNKTTDFYSSNWLKFINFLRITILLIEIKIREQLRKNNVRLKQFKEELNKENNNRLKLMINEIEKAKALYAQAGPAEEELTSNNHVNSGIKKNLPRYALTNEELRELSSSVAANQPINLSQISRNMLKPVGRRRNLNPIQPSHNNQNKMLTIQERLAAALRNNNNKKPASTNNLSARLAALIND